MSHGARPEKMKIASTGEGAGPTPDRAHEGSAQRLCMTGEGAGAT